MSTYLETIGRKVVKIPSNGKCLLLAIKKWLEVNIDIKRDEKNIVCKIWKELKDSLSFYSGFTTQNPMDLLNDAQQYLSMKRNSYTLEVVEVIVCTAANALYLNIKIFQEQEGFLKILAIEPARTPSPATIYMLFVRNSKPFLDPRNTNAYYNTIVITVLNKDPDFGCQYVDETEVSPGLSKYNVSHAGEKFI